MNHQPLTNKLTLQWIPAHYDVEGNEAADKHAKTGTKDKQQRRERKVQFMESLDRHQIAQRLHSIAT